jgi:hypothetical protein
MTYRFFNRFFAFLVLLLLASVIFANPVPVEAQSTEIAWLYRLPYDTDAGAIFSSQTSGLYLNAYNAALLPGYGVGHGANRGAIDFSASGASFRVVAARAGKVTVLNDGCGVIINHGDDTEALYYHLRNFQVTSNQYVNIGQYLGDADDCGEATANHLHLVVRPAGGGQEMPIRFATLGSRSDQSDTSNKCPSYLICPKQAGYEFYYPFDIPAQNKTSWDFNSGPELWFGTNDLGNMKLWDGGSLWFPIVNTDANTAIASHITGPIITPVVASEYPEVWVTLGRQNAGTCMALSWRQEGDSGFNADRRIELTGIPATGSGTYVFNVSSHENWTGNITRLRLHPTCSGITIADTTLPYAIRLDKVKLASATNPDTNVFQIVTSPEAAQLSMGETTNIIFTVENPQLAQGGGIRALDIECNVNPSIVTGTTLTSNSLFSGQAIAALVDEPAFPPGPGFQWLISERDGQPDLAATGTILNVAYTAAAEGTAQLLCNVDAIDGAGNLIANVPFIGTTITVLGNSSVSGIVTLDAATNHSGSTITLFDILDVAVATTVTAADGSFSIANVAPGTYQIEADAPGYVSTRSNDTSIGATVTLPSGLLIAGDINDDEVVDLLDITQFAADYPTQQITPTAAYDVTRDGTVNISDFFITVQNMDTVGPTVWE